MSLGGTVTTRHAHLVTAPIGENPDIDDFIGVWRTRAPASTALPGRPRGRRRRGRRLGCRVGCEGARHGGAGSEQGGVNGPARVGRGVSVAEVDADERGAGVHHLLDECVAQVGPVVPVPLGLPPAIPVGAHQHGAVGQRLCRRGRHGLDPAALTGVGACVDDPSRQVDKPLHRSTGSASARERAAAIWSTARNRTLPAARPRSRDRKRRRPHRRHAAHRYTVRGPPATAAAADRGHAVM